MKVALLLALPAASAFVAPAPKMARGRAMKMSFDADPGAVKFPPANTGYWDPLGFVKDGDVDKFNYYKSIEIKHGRVAMLAAFDYFLRGWGGYHFSGSFGETPIESIPVGLGAINKVPLFGWVQIILFVSLLEVLAPQRADKAPGDVQPDTPAFPKPGSAIDAQREVNNGRLAMVSMLGIWVGELITGGENPFTTFQPYAPLIDFPK